MARCIGGVIPPKAEGPPLYWAAKKKKRFIFRRFSRDECKNFRLWRAIIMTSATKILRWCASDVLILCAEWFCVVNIISEKPSIFFYMVSAWSIWRVSLGRKYKSNTSAHFHIMGQKKLASASSGYPRYQRYFRTKVSNLVDNCFMPSERFAWSMRQFRPNLELSDALLWRFCPETLRSSFRLFRRK